MDKAISALDERMGALIEAIAAGEFGPGVISATITVQGSDGDVLVASWPCTSPFETYKVLHAQLDAFGEVVLAGMDYERARGVAGTA